MNEIKNNKSYKQIISMCSEDKINFTYNYTIKNFKNLGCIYEIGTFGGAMTQALALGCGDYRPNIYTVDLFVWDEDKKSKFPYLPFDINDDFSTYVINSLKHLDNVEVFKSNFDKLKPKQKIELMFIDAPKRMKYVIKFLKIFPNFWLENKTKLLFEDYNQFLSYELPATLYPIHKNFKFYTDKSDIVIAEVLTQEIKKNEFDLMNIRKWDANEIKDNWDEICSIGDNDKFLDKDISIFMHLIDNNLIEQGKKFFRDKKIDLKKYEHKSKFVDRYSKKLI